jgi:putative DNA primase/helicase
MLHDLRAIARALGGEVVGGQVLAPGPGGHSRKDRSLSVRLSSTAPDGFLAFSHAGDDWRACRDHVKARLGLSLENAPPRPAEARRPPPQLEDEGREKKIADALSLWAASVDPRGTIVQRYLNSRALDIGEDIAGTVLRWHPRTVAMLALFRNVHTDAPQAVSRTFLDREGRKIERKFLGPVRGAAIKLDEDANVLGGLHIGEGVETCMAARQLGLRPTWALGSKGGIAKFPVLGGVECVTLLAEPDAATEVETCAAHWHAVGREVLINRSIRGKDLNDAIGRTR